MNIVTPYPSNIPINTVNVATESARRDNQLRDMITKPNASEAGVAERGVASEHDKSKSPQQQQGNVEGGQRGAEGHQKIAERQQGQQGESGQGQEQQGKEREQAQKQLERTEKELQRQQQTEIRQLQSRDVEVRTHEQAHAAAGGRYAGSPTYEFKRGPNGRTYVVGGEVSIDTSPVPGDPGATIQKMQQVRAAALAPAEPSSQDRSVAASANQALNQAQAEQAKEAAEKSKQQLPESAEKAQALEKTTNGVDEQTKAAQVKSENASAIDRSYGPRQNVRAGSRDPFAILFGDNKATTKASNTRSGQSVGEIFGAAGAPGGEHRAEVNANRQAAEQRNAAVVARAGRVESFYAKSTIPQTTGFSQFA